MAVAGTMTDRGIHIARTFASAWEALKEHAKTNPSEALMIADRNAAHLKSAYPSAEPAETPAVARALVVPAAAVERKLHRDHSTKLAYTITAEGGCTVVTLRDEDGDIASASLLDEEVDQLCGDLQSVKAV